MHRTVGQAERLVELFRSNTDSADTTTVVYFVSGKGGTGKSTISLALTNLLSPKKRILFIDINLTFPTAHILLNHYPNKTLKHYFEKDDDYESIIKRIGNYDIIFGDNVECDLPNYINDTVLLIKTIKMSGKYDLIIADTGTDSYREFLSSSAGNDLVVIVATPEPTSVIDSYLIMKNKYQNELPCNHTLLINKCNSVEEAGTAQENISKSIEYFLKKDTEFLGTLNNNAQVQEYIYSTSGTGSPLISQQFSALSETLLKKLQLANNHHYDPLKA